jgi:hypothetical protein
MSVEVCSQKTFLECISYAEANGKRLTDEFFKQTKKRVVYDSTRQSLREWTYFVLNSNSILYSIVFEKSQWEHKIYKISL